MIAASEDEPAQRAYIAVIATPCQRDVALFRGHVIRWVDVQPPCAGTIHGYPGVRRIGSDQARPSRRGVGSQVSADIPRRQVHRSEAGNLHMREILAHAAALL